MRRIATVLATTALASVAIGAGASAAYAADQPSLSGMNTGRIAGGIALLGVAAGGVVMLRRRRADNN